MRGHPTIAPWQDDGSNPSRAGTYLAARVLYAIGLAPTIPGREQQTLALFNEVSSTAPCSGSGARADAPGRAV